MELKKLKARLKTAQRGHKLLKDKTDEMVRRFSVLAREIKKLRAGNGRGRRARSETVFAGARTDAQKGHRTLVFHALRFRRARVRPRQLHESGSAEDRSGRAQRRIFSAALFLCGRHQRGGLRRGTCRRSTR